VLETVCSDHHRLAEMLPCSRGRQRNSAQNAIAIAEVLREESALRIVDWDYDIINRAEMLLRANRAAAAKNKSRLKHN
jgi:hypothetical protein